MMKLESQRLMTTMKRWSLRRMIAMLKVTKKRLLISKESDLKERKL